MRRCSNCNRLLPVSQFHWANKARTYRRLDCRDCCTEKRQTRMKDPIKLKKYRIDHRYAVIKHKYGITRLEVDALLASQRFQCAICQNPIGLSSAFDHCHKSGKVRGILCRQCNSGLGMFRDDPIVLDSATRYLKGDGSD